MSSKSWAVAGFAALTLTLGSAMPAKAYVQVTGPLLLSDIVANNNLYYMTVGDISYYFDRCEGGGCTANNEVVGVPASASTGPGGGLMLQAHGTLTTQVLPATGDIALFWSATTPGNSMIAITGSADGGGVSSGGGTTLDTYNYGTTNYDPLQGVNMDPAGSLDKQPFPTALNNVRGQIDLTASSPGYLNTGSIFISEVPEPASVLLMLSALGVLGGVRQRRRSNAA